MIARAYFQLVDAIAAARTDSQLEELRGQLATTAMHPFERRALERQIRARALALQAELDLGRHARPAPGGSDRPPAP